MLDSNPKFAYPFQFFFFYFVVVVFTIFTLSMSIDRIAKCCCVYTTIPYWHLSTVTKSMCYRVPFFLRFPFSEQLFFVFKFPRENSPLHLIKVQIEYTNIHWICISKWNGKFQCLAIMVWCCIAQKSHYFDLYRFLLSV